MGFFNRLFPHWKPKTILGKALKGLTAVIMPVPSILGVRTTLILGAAATGVGALGAAGVTIGSAAAAASRLIQPAVATIDELSKKADAIIEVAEEKAIVQATQKEVEIAQKEEIDAAVSTGLIEPKETDEGYVISPWLIISGIGIVLLLISGISGISRRK